MKNFLLLAFVLGLGSLGCNAEPADRERISEPEPVAEASSTLLACDPDGEHPRCMDFSFCDSQCQEDCEAAGYNGGCCQDHFLCAGNDMMCRCYDPLSL